MPESKCSATSHPGPGGSKRFRFHPGQNKRFNFRNELSFNTGHYFRFTNHQVELKQVNNNIKVSASLRVHSNGYKTNGTLPEPGKAPKVSYELKDANGNVIKLVENLVTADFGEDTGEPNTHDERKGDTTVDGQNVDDVKEVCWSISDYRIVKAGSHGHGPQPNPPRRGP